MKRVLTLFLALVFAIGICFSAPITFTASAAETTTSEFWFYLNEDEKSYSVEAYDKSKVSGKVVLPSSYNGLPVTRIDPFAFSGCTQLTGITIPGTITEIGNGAFYECVSLSSVTIPDSVKIIDDSAFSGCTGLGTVKLGNNLEKIGDFAFSKNAIKSIVLPNSVKEIGEYAFSNCADLSDITFSDNVTSLGRQVFYNTAYYGTTSNWQNGALYMKNCLIGIDSTIRGSLSIKEGTTCIADGFLSSCYYMTSVNIPKSVRYMSVDTFSSSYITQINVDANNPYFTSINGVLFNKAKTELIKYPVNNESESYVVPSSVTKIGPNAFYSARNLVSVTVPDSVTTIGPSAFESCYSLENITLGKNINKIGRYAFFSSDFYSDESNWVDNVLYCGKYILATNGDVSGDYTIKEDTLHIADYAFYSNDLLTSVVMPNSVRSIGDNCFSSCYALKSITLSSNLKAIPAHCFDCDSSLVSVTIPNSVTKICESAFSNTKIAKVVIGTGVKTIEDNAFELCINLTTVEYKGTAANWWKISIGKNNEDLLEARISSSDKELIITTPVVKIRASSYGMYVDWSAVAIADSYDVYRSVYNASTKKWSGWTKIKNVKYEGYSDNAVRVGTTYRYTVRAVVGKVLSDFSPSNSVKFDVAPTVKIANASNGIKVTWNTIASVKTYKVYSSTYNAKTKKWTGWKSRANVNGTTWTDKSAKSGTYYKYTVRAIDGKVAGSFKGTSGLLFLAQPTVKIANNANGVKVAWNKIAGATGYTVYRSEYKNGAWTKWASRGTAKANKTSWTDTKVASGVQYKYTVRAINGKVASTYVSSNTVLYLAQPKTTVKAVSNGINVAWTQSAGATGYTVYRMEYNAKTKKWSGWKNMGTAKATKKSWTDKSAKKGVTYRYTVKAVNGKVASTYKASGNVKR